MLALWGLALASAAQAQLSGVTGGGQPFSNLQPSLGVTQTIPLQGIFPRRDDLSADAEGGTLGFVYSFAGDFVPGRMAPADGRLLPISSNTAVFSLLGTTYGGDGRVNFALPDLKGRAIVGDGAGPGLTPRTIGEPFGSATVTLSLSQMPEHRHSLAAGGFSDPAGGASPFHNAQPSLTMRRVIAVQGVYPSSFGSNPSAFLGQVATFAGNFTPSGWAEADGQLLSIAENTALFSLLGTSFGGDGQNTFALPDLRGRVSIGASNLLPIGSVLGEEDTSLNANQLPAHVHSLNGGGTTGPAGASALVDNMQPSLALNHLIALEGIFPSPHSGSAIPDAPMIGQIAEFAGSFAPGGWALAHGQLLQISQHETLFQLIGTTYGGDGQETFALPDLRGRTMIGTGFSAELGHTVVTGESMGSEVFSLSQAHLPQHLHAVPVPEPETWALWLAGLAGLGLARGRARGAGPRAAQGVGTGRDRA